MSEINNRDKSSSLSRNRHLFLSVGEGSQGQIPETHETLCKFAVESTADLSSTGIL
jgi:hypothetical protein